MTDRRPVILVLDWPDGAGTVPVTVAAKRMCGPRLLVHRIKRKLGWLKVRRPTTHNDQLFTANVGVETDEHTYSLLTGLTDCGQHPGLVFIPPMQEVVYDTAGKIKL